ncbi:MAG: glycosyltransferase [Chitinivibrionales bacterium]|nr:glycosyltransferase [Chitinivibrionales bacterium]MBD3396527.1 glycosyltransferase [Chitinivibrionales bacterium]
MGTPDRSRHGAALYYGPVYQGVWSRLRSKGGMLSDATLSMFVPAYNAAATLYGVIKRVPGTVWPRLVSCWIINDGSTDLTGSVIYNLTQANRKIRAVHFEQNRGYGAVAQKALSLCRNDGCDMAACLHADGQYPPEVIPQFMDTMRDRGYDILQGSRIASGTALSGGMPRYKYVAGKILTFFENRVFGLSMSDYHSGFMFYSRRALDTIRFETLSRSFDFDLEMIASARALGLSIGEMPIPTHYGTERSYLNPVSYGLRVLRAMGRYALGRYGRSR